MTGLQEAFYIVALVYMGIMLILVVVALAALLVIRNKVTHIQHSIEDRLHAAKDLAQKGAAVADTLKKVTRRGRRK